MAPISPELSLTTDERQESTLSLVSWEVNPVSILEVLSVEGISRFRTRLRNVASPGMTTYLVECYWPGVDERKLGSAVDRLRRDDGVVWVSSILIPDDEIVICLATGPSSDSICAAARGAGLPAERVVSCIQVSTRER